MKEFEVGDLVRDKLNEDAGAYGLGVVVATDVHEVLWEPGETNPEEEVEGIIGKRYDVYFTKFERTITFHGDYLEKV
jgi:hypothetical protein